MNNTAASPIAFSLIVGILYASLLGCGATPFPGVSQSASEATYAAVNKTILQPLCVSCHSSEEPKGGVSVSTYDDLMGSAGAVVPYQPYQSQLFMQCFSGQMPRDATRLNRTQLKLIYDWISFGATNN